MYTTKIILKKIVFLRNSRGLRQEDMARHLQISTSSYSKMETGRTNIGISRFFAITSLLGVEYGIFLDEEDPEVKVMEEEMKAVKDRLYEYDLMIIKEQQELIRIYDQKNGHAKDRI